VARLEEFPRSAVERVGSEYVIQYRGQILPLIPVSRALQKNGRRTKGNAARDRRRHARRNRKPERNSETIHVVVHAGKDRPIGLVVGRILDIAEETIATRSPPTRPGVLFNAVVQDHVTEFLDLEQIVRPAAARGS
jgi:two-component system chemotaxis sensor kinase CheA